MDPDGPIFTADFSIFGHDLIGMNWAGGPHFNESISLSIQCDGQKEIDRLWKAITKEGQEGQCGWCKDKWGLSWQVTPFELGGYLGNADPVLSHYANQAFRKMKKIVIRDLYE
jgi:predicted 3-demethylubiquinone-9 3-methyltransferase (glyoxalase superfamily)